MDLRGFVNANQGKKITVDGNFPVENPYQCWDIGAAYLRDVFHAPAPYLPTTDKTVLSTFNYFPSFLSNYFTKVTNNPHDANQVPPVGALVFWGTDVNKYGDVAVCLDPRPGQLNFTAFCQNAPIGAPAQVMSRSYRGVLGWFAPKVAPAPEPLAPPPAEAPAPQPEYEPIDRTVVITVPTLLVRAEATTDSPSGQADRAYSPDGNLHSGNTVTITGWKHGQNVEGNDIWLRSIHGKWFWSGGTNYHG